MAESAWRAPLSGRQVFLYCFLAVVCAGIVLPILVSLAFVGCSVHSSVSPARVYKYQGPPPSLASDLQAGRVASVVVDATDKTLKVTRTGDQSEEYTVSYPDDSNLRLLLQQEPSVKVTWKTAGSPWWRSWVLAPLISALVLVAGLVGFFIGRGHGRGGRTQSDPDPVA